MPTRARLFIPAPPPKRKALGNRQPEECLPVCLGLLLCIVYRRYNNKHTRAAPQFHTLLLKANKHLCFLSFFVRDKIQYAGRSTSMCPINLAILFAYFMCVALKTIQAKHTRTYNSQKCSTPQSVIHYSRTVYGMAGWMLKQWNAQQGAQERTV